MKQNIRKIVKVCGTPQDFVFDFIDGASQEADIRRMKEYVACVKRIEKLSRPQKKNEK